MSRGGLVPASALTVPEHTSLLPSGRTLSPLGRPQPLLPPLRRHPRQHCSPMHRPAHVPPSASPRAGRSALVIAPLGRLRLPPVLLGAHLPLDVLEQALQVVCPVPVRQTRYSPRLHVSIVLVNVGEVNARGELDSWWPVGVLLAARDHKRQDAPLQRRPMRPDNHAIPRGERHVLAIGQPVADLAISNPLLAPFQLIQQHEVARDDHGRLRHQRATGKARSSSSLVSL
mmetsp:Transcript_33366/g.78966  ORF Transcript_33366/g.78966 Transcript_33366/m.78966 type:complete len:229 (-) Transcript_33366:15-701(-)